MSQYHICFVVAVVTAVREAFLFILRQILLTRPCFAATDKWSSDQFMTQPNFTLEQSDNLVSFVRSLTKKKLNKTRIEWIFNVVLCASLHAKLSRFLFILQLTVSLYFLLFERASKQPKPPQRRRENQIYLHEVHSANTWNQLKRESLPDYRWIELETEPNFTWKRNRTWINLIGEQRIWNEKSSERNWHWKL